MYDAAYERSVARRRRIAMIWCLLAMLVEALGSLSCLAAGNWQAASWAAVSLFWTGVAARLTLR
jgi:hypothetical protein